MKTNSNFTHIQTMKYTSCIKYHNRTSSKTGFHIGEEEVVVNGCSSIHYC